MKIISAFTTGRQSIARLSIFLLVISSAVSICAAQLKEARVTQVIKDVKLLGGQAAKPAAVNDNVSEGTAVRTGADSRTELTFADLTITRLGANTVFGFNEGARQINLDSGAMLLSVPRNGAPARISTAAATAAITGGTALMEYHKGTPVKLYILEGQGYLCSTTHSQECVTVKGGETATVDVDGHVTAPARFNVGLLYKTALLITDFPELPNVDLIQQNFDQPPPDGNPNNGSNNLVDIVDQHSAANPATNPTPQGTPGKFGPPATITSPDPYVISSGTQIQTDPTITTNGVTDFGKIYRGPSIDGPFSTYAFGSTSAFDTASGINAAISDSGAVFKFSSLQLTGNPTVVTTNGETSLALIGVNGVTSGAAGGQLTFAGINGFLIATQNGSINLGSEVSFSGFQDINFYARGAGATLTLGSDISVANRIRLFSQGAIQINGSENAADFSAHAGSDFGTGTNANVDASKIDIFAGNNLNFATANFTPGEHDLSTVRLEAGNAVNIDTTGNTAVFGNVTQSVNVIGPTINLTGNTTISFLQGVSATFTAGTGGIQGVPVTLRGDNITLSSAADINIASVQTYFAGDNPILGGSITAATSFLGTGNVFTGTIHAGTDITMGGALVAGDISAGGVINVDDGIKAVGGSITAGGDIITAAVLELSQDANNLFGNITAGGNIVANGGIFTPGNPVVVSAGGSISAPAVITGTLQARTDIFITNALANFSFGIIANHISAGGTLTLDNAPTISPNNGGSGGNDGETLSDFTMTVGSIVSTGPAFPVLSSNGGDANPNFADSNPGNGGNISLTTTIGGLTIGNAQDLDSISANGGAYNAGGPFGGGNGGKIDIMSAGDVVINAPNSGGPAIFASTGVVADDTTTFAGNGGTVNVTSTGGAVTVNGTVQVSNDDQRIPSNNSAGRASATGGTIDLQSNLTAGTGITVGTNGALLSYLSLNALNAGGTAGSITLSTMGADIVVNGTVRADFGTITIDQNDPAAAIPLITLDGGTLQAATFNINGSGDLTIGPNNSTAINIFGGTWNVAHDITIDAANTTFAYSFALSATAGNAINFTGGNSDVSATVTLPLSGDSTFTAGIGGINAQFVDIHYAGAALNLISAGDITANSITFTDGFSRGNVNAAGAIAITGNLWEGDITAGTSLNVGGGIIGNAITAGTTITAGQYISARSLTAGGDITAGNTRVQFITAPTGVLRVAFGISPSVFSTGVGFPQGAVAPHVFTVDSIVSPNGIDFSGNQFDGIAGFSSGGLLTINANSLTFDPSTGIGPVNFNGADVNGFSNGTTPTAPGDGGTLTVNSATDITVNAPITASSGLTNQNGDIGGAGGTVTLNSSAGTVTTSSTIQVSHADPTPGPVRRSASGGNINITSGRDTGVAINVSNSSQLLALLDAAAPGPGGKITIRATGASSQANVAGRVQADRGTVDIQHTGDSGQINIAAGTSDLIDMRGDIVKIGALGTNGTLTVGAGTINADTILKLYANGSNGTVNFIANVALNGTSTKIIAGNTVNIFDNVVVTIGGNSAAQVYTNNANYTGFGGNGSRTGTFGGAGANNPQPLANAPPFGP